MKPRYGLTLKERIERDRVIRNECWETSLDPNHKYPQMQVNGRNEAVHRVAWQEYVGPIPTGLNVLHKCDNTRCHRPKHLFLGTHADNMKDMVRKGRNKSAHPRHDSNIRECIVLMSEHSQMKIAEVVGVSQFFVSLVLRQAGVARGRTTSFNKGHGLGGRRRP